MFYYYGYENPERMYAYKAVKSKPRLGRAAEVMPTDTTEDGYDTSAFYPVDSEGRYHGYVYVMTADASCMIPVECGKKMPALMDTGADLMLITRDSSDALGFDLNMINDNFSVQGIYGQPTEFKNVQTWVQLGNMKPLWVPLGLCTTKEGLQENLLGSKGILTTGSIQAVYDSRGVTYRNNIWGVANAI